MIADTLEVREKTIEHGDDRELKWKEDALVLRQKINFPEDMTVWIGNHNLRGVPANAMFYENIQLAYWEFKRKYGASAEPNAHTDWVGDLTQSPKRKVWGPVVPSLTQRSLPYIFSMDRTLNTEDHRVNAWNLLHPSSGAVNFIDRVPPFLRKFCVGHM